MATTVINNPDNVPGAVTTGYQAQNTVLFASMTGHNQVSLDKDARAVKQGSVFELNGNIARVTEDEGINGSLCNEAVNWVYAMPYEENIGFEFSDTAPLWDRVKGGWYREGSNERALITVITDSSGNIAGTNLLTNAFDTLVPPNAGGESAGEWNVRTHTSVHLNRGWHRYEITSGATGNGGGGSGGPGAGSGAIPGGAGGGGGVASTSNTITGVFFHNGGGLIVHVGGSGANGSNGSNGADSATNRGAGGGGGGSGAGAGEESYIISGSQKFCAERIGPGGGGGGGGGGSNWTATVTAAENGSDGNTGFVAGGGAGGTGAAGNPGFRGGSGGGSVLEKIFNTVNDNRYVFHNGEGVIGGGVGNADADGGNGALNDAGFGGSGGAGGAGGGPASVGAFGGNGANGGAAPGWMRPFGDPAAGCVQIWRLS